MSLTDPCDEPVGASTDGEENSANDADNVGRPAVAGWECGSDLEDLPKTGGGGRS